MLGIAFTIISSFWFGFSTVTMRRGVATGSALNGLYLTLIPGVPLFWLAAFATGQFSEIGALGSRSVFLLMGAGVVHFLLGRYCTLRAMAEIGANRASPVIVTSVLVSVGAAVVWLGESVTPLMWGGIALVIAGPGIAASSLSRKPSPVTSSGSPAAEDAGRVSFDDLPRARLAKGYAWASLNAVAFGSSPLLIREALDGTGLGVLGGTIAYTTAGLLIALVLLAPGQMASLRGVPTTTRNWFLAAAITIMAAQMFRFLGLTYAPVSVAVPLLRGGSVFIYVMSYFVNRDLESFSPRVIIGTAVAVVGAIALVV